MRPMAVQKDARSESRHRRGVSNDQPPTKRVLLVDDEPALRKVACCLLEQRGYEVVEAAGGLEATDLIRDPAVQFDCAVLDCRMPDLNGRAVFVVLQQERPGTPALFLSGCPDALDDLGGLDADGTWEFQPKSSDAPRLFAALERVRAGGARGRGRLAPVEAGLG